MDMIKKYIKEKYNKQGNVYLGLVHRLDRPVGGIMVFAKTSKAASRLSRDFNDHKIDKYYLAIVNGNVDFQGEFIDKIDRDSNGNSIINSSGKFSKLSYKLLEYNKIKDCSLVLIKLMTGRHHQIRVVYSSRYHYLLCDQIY